MTSLTCAQQVAGTILDEPGARRFLMMIGASKLVATAQGLQFTLPADCAVSGVNMIRVELNELDTFDVIAGRCACLDFNEKARVSMIHAQDLQSAFTRLIGLDTCI